MEHKEECVEFINPDGFILRGILHHADQDHAKGVSLICLNTGLNDMVGWHRIQVKTSRYLTEYGYNVLRFDDTGIGDSDGEILKESIVEIFSDIESGLFVLNADAAVDFVNKNFPEEKIIFLGFCGGGLTAFHSAAQNQKIAGVIGHWRADNAFFQGISSKKRPLGSKEKCPKSIDQKFFNLDHGLDF